MRLIVFATDAFATPLLEAAARHDLAAVVSRTAKPQGRGMKTLLPPAAAWAKSRRLPLLTFEKLSGKEAKERLLAVKADLFVVCAFGLYLPRPIFEIPRYCVNFHPSLLPRFRGGAPIQRALLCGDRTTGACCHFISERLDAGDLIAVREVPIQEDDDAGRLSERLSVLCAQMLPEVLAALEQQRYTPRRQDDQEALYAPSLQRHEEQIFWENPGALIQRQIRALSPKPGAYTWFGKARLKIRRARACDAQCPPGRLVFAGRLLVGTGTCALELIEVQPEGKKPMPAPDWWRGARGKAAFFTYRAPAGP